LVFDYELFNDHFVSEWYHCRDFGQDAEERLFEVSKREKEGRRGREEKLEEGGEGRPSHNKVVCVGKKAPDFFFSDPNLHSRIEEDENELDDETGWKLLNTDVFRAPRWPSFFCVLFGSGVQVLGMAVITMSMLG
jgi:hypothetical protein